MILLLHYLWNLWYGRKWNVSIHLLLEALFIYHLTKGYWFPTALSLGFHIRTIFHFLEYRSILL
jgi:hypothetical protein